MSLQSRLQDLATRVATECKSLRTLINGNTSGLTTLTTPTKTHLIGAINDLQSQLTTLAGGAVGIADGVSATSSTWSSTKIIEQLEAYKMSILGGASGAYDTLLELENFISANGGVVAGLTTALGNRVRTDTAAQGLDSTQKANARTNIDAVSTTDIGDPDTNFVTGFNSGLV